MSQNESTLQANREAAMKDQAPIPDAKDSSSDEEEDSSKGSNGEFKTSVRLQSHHNFPMRLHQMLQDVENAGLSCIVSWQSHGRSFRVHKKDRFVKEIMKKYFRQSHYTSFQRQLNIYGFKRLSRGPDKGAYWHELFVRNSSFLSKFIDRVKLKDSEETPTQVFDGSEPDFYNSSGSTNQALPVDLLGYADHPEALPLLKGLAGGIVQDKTNIQNQGFPFLSRPTNGTEVAAVAQATTIQNALAGAVGSSPAFDPQLLLHQAQESRLVSLLLIDQLQKQNAELQRIQEEQKKQKEEMERQKKGMYERLLLERSFPSSVGFPSTHVPLFGTSATASANTLDYLPLNGMPLNVKPAGDTLTPLVEMLLRSQAPPSL